MTTTDKLVEDLRDWAASICAVRNDKRGGSKVRLLIQAANEIAVLKLQRNQFRDAYSDAERILRRFENKCNEIDPGPEWDQWRCHYADGTVDPPPSATNPETGIQYGDIE